MARSATVAIVMSRLRIPTVQHLARNWHDSPEEIRDALLNLARNAPQFNYNSINDAARDILLYRVPEEQIAEGIRRTEKRENVRKILLEVLHLLCEHLATIRADHVHMVAPRYYPLGRGLRVPFRPPMIYIVGGQLYFPWFSFWKSNPLSADRLSLFVTLVDSMLSQDPELEDARFQIVDFSADSSSEGRQLRVIEGADIPRFDQTTLENMLSVFVKGFDSAVQSLASEESKSERSKSEVVVDENQLILWD